MRSGRHHHTERSTSNRDSNLDKRRRAEVALQDPEMRGQSDRSLARLLGVSQPFISAIRKALAGNKKPVVPDNVISKKAATPATRAGERPPVEPPFPLTGEELNAAGASPLLAKRILDRLIAMPRNEREDVQEVLRKMMI